MDPEVNRGAALLLAMVFMLMLTMIAAMVMRTGHLQLRMAGNDQFLEEAFHLAQAVATELSLGADNFPLDTEAGDVICPQASEDIECDYRLLPAPQFAQTPEGVSIDYRITRQEPRLWHGFPIRESEHSVSSSIRFDAAIFDISVRINGSERKLGSAHIVQGIAVRVPAIH
jgi:hypothetical protein